MGKEITRRDDSNRFFGVCEVYHLHYAENTMTEYHSLSDKGLTNYISFLECW